MAQATNWLLKAGEAWTELTNAAAKRKRLTYKELGAPLGLHHRSVRLALGPIQEFCTEEHLPLLPAIVVNASVGIPGRGSYASGRSDLEQIQNDVFAFDWASRPNPFQQFSAETNVKTLLQRLLDHPESSAEIYSLVRNRGLAQRLFRQALGAAYHWQCAMCGLSFESALEAAHIIPWPEAEPSQRTDVRNGLLLCATHHRLFDSGYITVTEQYTVHYYDPAETQDGHYTTADSALTSALHGTPLKLPSALNHQPLLEWIRKRNASLDWLDETPS